MGTSGLTIVHWNDAYHIAQYGQWDHHPSGQGAVVLEFARIPGNIDKLRRVLKAGRLYKPEQEDIDQWNSTGVFPPSLHRSTGAKILELVADLDDNANLPKDGESELCADLSNSNRDPDLPSASAFTPISTSSSSKDEYERQWDSWKASKPTYLPLHTELELITSEIFCEWSYVLDLDENALEVFSTRARKNVQQRPSTRFDFLPIKRRRSKSHNVMNDPKTWHSSHDANTASDAYIRPFVRKGPMVTIDDMDAWGGVQTRPPCVGCWSLFDLPTKEEFLTYFRLDVDDDD
jgi:hypothetical protein